MAYDFVPASSQRLSTASSPVSGYPMTLAAWAMVDDTNNDRIILAVNESTTPFHRVTLLRAANNRFNAAVFGSINTAALARTYATVSSGQFYHVCGVFASSTSRKTYMDGVLLETDTRICTINTLNELLVGARFSTTPGLFWDGKIAEAGIWNTDLNDDEVKSLAAGMTCDKVRPQSLVFYAPLVRDLIDAKGGLTITNNNGATVANHPRVYA